MKRKQNRPECCCVESYEPQYVVGIDPVNHVIVDSPVYTDEDADLLVDQLSQDGVEDIEVFDDPDDARDHAMELLSDEGVTDLEQVSEPEEHSFSDVTIYTTRYFSDVTEFMFKMFSEAEDEVTDSQDVIEDAISEGEVQETDSEVVTPIDDDTAVVHDKDNDEYTKVTLEDGEMNVEKISEDEADELIDSAEEEKEETKKFSLLRRFFAEVAEEAIEAQEQEAAGKVNPEEVDPETGDPVQEGVASSAQPVEVVEDKALEAVQSIQEAANQAVLAITEAKEAPAPGEEEDLREAKFSYYYDYGYPQENDTLSNFLMNI